MGFKNIPALTYICEKVDDALPFGHVGDLTKSENSSANILRNYGIGAQILADLQIKNLILLSNHKQSVIGLEGYDIKIAGYRKLY